MSQAVREAIAAAAGLVAGVTCQPYYVAVTKTGAACVRLDRTEYPNRFGGVDHWQVIVRLPQDLAEAERFIEDHRTVLYAALSAELVVTSMTPAQIVFDAGSAALPCLIVAGHRAEEE